MNFVRLCLCLLLALSLVYTVSAARAQGEYVVCSGDVLDVTVFGEQELSGSYPVGFLGRIRMPLVGDVDVADYTPAQVQEKLTAELKQFMRRPQVTVVLNEQMSKRRVYVVGEVKNGGAYELPLGAQPLDAIGAAGGFTELADPSTVNVISGGKSTVVDLSKPATAGMTLPGGLRTGDFVYVTRSRKTIAIVGYVNRPGRYPWEEDITVLDAVGQLAGGPLETADLPAATLIHADNTRESVDLTRLFGEGDLSQNKTLQPGDSIVIPRARAISVVGQVNTPTSFVTGSELHVLDAIAQASGLQPNADLSGTFVLRGTESIPVDLNALLREGDISQNILVKPGDVLVVPQAEKFEILVVGEVNHPGSFAPRPGLTVLGAITEAGGPTNSANLKRVAIVRDEGTVAVNLDGVVKGTQVEHNVRVRAGDIVLVPSTDKIYVFGGVRKAGIMPMPEENTLLSAIGQAGGPLENARLDDVRVLRLVPESSEPMVLRSNLSKLIKDGDPAQNISLESGDVVFVPQKGKKTDWGAIRDILWTAGWILRLL